MSDVPQEQSGSLHHRDEVPAELEAGRPKRRTSRRVLLAVAIFLTVLVVVVIGGLVALQQKTRTLQKRWDDKLAELRKKGEPVSMAELAPPALPDDQNAAVLHEQAFKLLEDIPRGTDSRLNELLPRKGAVPKAVDLAEARKLLESCKPALDLVRRGTLRPKCRFKRDYNAVPPVLLLTLMSGTSRTGGFLDYDCRMNLVEGRPDDAVADCVTMLRVADGLKDEPLLVDQLVRIAVIDRGTDALQRVLDRSEPGAAALTEAAGVLKRLDSRESLVWTVRGERCYGIALIRQALEDPAKFLQNIGTKGHWTRLTALSARPLFLADGADYLDRMGRLQDLVAKPYYQNHEILQQWEDQIAQEQEDTAHIFTGKTLLWISKIPLTYDRSLAGIGNARLAIALRLYRMKHGQYPDALAALVPDFIEKLPTDPFSGKDFIYRRDGNGFVLESVGDDDQTYTEWKTWKCSR